MYHQYFGLNEAPFSIAVNPRYLFMSPRHRDALAHLLYGVGSGGGFILLTGEVGTGKTTINRCLLEQLPDATDVAIILNPALDALELLATVCDELGIDYQRDRPTLKTLTDSLHGFLLQNHAAGRRTVLMIDEAQHLDYRVLEQIRLLTNLETNSEKLLQIILIGQPELAQLLQQPELRQLNQRITARYDLAPLSLEETSAYIRHRLQVAGLAPGRELFPPDVVRGVHRVTRGIPRLINVLCDRILLGCYGRNRQRADQTMLKLAAREVMGEELAGRSHSRWLAVAGGAAVVSLLLGLGWWLLRPQSAPPASPVATAEATQVAQVENTATGTDWLLTTGGALQQLWQLQIGEEAAATMPAGLCGGEIHFPLSCLREQAQTWQELVELERPLLLELVTPARSAAAAVFLGVEDDNALLWAGEAPARVALTELAPLWRGGYRLLWRPPAGFDGPLALGDSGPAVAAVAAMFARIDGQQQPLASDTYNNALATRVRLFQRRQQLQADGIVGVQTLLRLNAALGRDRELVALGKDHDDRL
ncbi:ExeA family protein [Kineobactrum salinum]|uniref:AAA family ATPase n=1 Tax=Kineobactrum salinum TaxID=2708301 RepID=A0A6C0U713_9GAMM|nr:ExeA family protein [Kineobactrum salinum]QIB66737.1 AAA family ATPase [Kineobactrum salinum]